MDPSFRLPMVMARWRGEARGVRWLALPDALPWWTRATAEPGVALAAAAAALLLWREDRIVSGTRSADVLHGKLGFAGRSRRHDG